MFKEMLPSAFHDFTSWDQEWVIEIVFQRFKDKVAFSRHVTFVNLQI